MQLRAMAMALPAGPDHVHVVFGVGTMSCMLDDNSLTELFHSLRPHNWKPEGKNALAQEMIGTWSYTGGGTVHIRRFSANGRSESHHETTSA